ncbi:saccharopine dehydrogenase NADP-binding domain-containing protein [Methanobrevibacter sp.]
MKTLDERLKIVENHVKSDEITIMIIGLGSVGTYLLDFLVSKNDPSIKLVVVGRNAEKIQSDVNIVRVASLIRELNKSQIEIEANVDLEDISSIEKAIAKHSPDFIVNSSRAYAGIKYGSISWHNVRAYGIWTPLSIKFTKNIMEACENVDTDAVIINTSYSDAVIPWLKSAEKAYPDFGSGNLNHLIPRMKFAVANILEVDDFWNVDFNFAAAHFHDVVISKEGQTEGVELPLKIYYKGEEQDIPHEDIFSQCSISMPVDQKRNMMNASSNYRIISAVIDAIRTGENQKVFAPGVFGHIGGYPVIIGYKDDKISAWIDESVFSFDEMDKANRESLALDGIEDIKDATLIYTDDLISKVKKAFDEDLPKEVKYEDIEKTANFLIEKIITPQLNG